MTTCTAGPRSDDDDAATAAVVAHGLLNSIAAAQGLVQTLVARYDDLPDDVRRELLARTLERLHFNHETVRHLILAIPVSPGGPPA